MPIHKGQYATYIFDKLKSKVRVAVEVFGYESELKSPELIYARHQALDTLMSFGSVAASVERQFLNSFPPNQKVGLDVRHKIGMIDSELRRFGEALAQNALRADTEIDQVSDSHFEKLARLFESRNHANLVLVSPYWHSND